MKPQSLIEVFSENDLETLKKSADIDHAYDRLLSIVKRLPEPRVYVGEPMGTVGENGRDLWGMGRDVLTSMLAQKGLSIIDPDTLWWVIIWNEYLKKKAKVLNPFLERLMMAGCLRHVYLAEEKLALQGRTEKIYRIALGQGVRMHVWSPKVS